MNASRRLFLAALVAPFLPEDIDYSDIPELDDSFFARAAHVGPLPVPPMAEWQAMACGPRPPRHTAARNDAMLRRLDRAPILGRVFLGA